MKNLKKAAGRYAQKEARRLAWRLRRRAADRHQAAARALILSDDARQRAQDLTDRGDHPNAFDARRAADRYQDAAAILAPDTYLSPQSAP